MAKATKASDATRSLSIKVKDAQAMLGALAALDGCQHIVVDKVGEAEVKRVVREPYAIGGRALLAIAINTNALRPLVQAAGDAERALFKRLTGDKSELKASAPEARELQAEQEKIMNGEQEVDLRAIAFADLRADDNRIPPSVISALMPILDLDGQ